MNGLPYEKKIDLELYRQMVELIYRLSAKPDKAYALKQMEEDSLFWEEPRQSMEEAYGLHYPGEVLERLKDKTKLTVPKIRALCLALGDTKEIQSEGMFLGTQLRGFMQNALKGPWQKDCYLLAADYLLSEKGKKEAYERFLAYPWETGEEMIFALSILPEDELLWEKIKAPLNRCFGKERTLDVYRDGELYLWLSSHIAEKMKGYRKKDLENLKHLARLSKEPAREGSTLRKNLMVAGYTLAEVLFLNATFLKAGTCGIMRDSIPAERLAVEYCKFVLNEEAVYPESVYALCCSFLEDYREFAVKIQGAFGILPYLRDDIQLKNWRSYQCLYPYQEVNYQYHLGEAIFYIDLTDDRWDPLYTWMKKEEFDVRVAQTISGKAYTDEALGMYLQRYEELTGESYVAGFWKKMQSNIRKRAFFRLAEAGIIEPPNLARDYVRQQKEGLDKNATAWLYMCDYLYAYMEGIPSPKAFSTLEVFMGAWSSLKDSEKSGLRKQLLESFEIQTWGEGRRCFERMNFLRPFLSAKEHNQMFLWLEEAVFYEITEAYPYFWARILEDRDTVLWMPKEEAREICFRILPQLKDRYDQKRLQKQYMTKEEFERQEQRIKEQERQKKQMEEEREARKIKRKFTKWIAAREPAGRLELGSFISGYRYPWRELTEKLAASYLKSFWKKSRKIQLSQSQTAELLMVEIELLKKEHLPFEVIKNTVGCMEVKSDA